MKLRIQHGINVISGSRPFCAGALFEAMFCCQLQNEGVLLILKNETSERFEVNSLSYKVEDEWLEPPIGLNSGYDLVYVNRNAGMVLFV